MTIKIRRGIFETNSSSTHSISIALGLPPTDIELTPDEQRLLEKLEGSSALLDRLTPDEDGVLRLEYCNREFGWERETYTDAGTKAVYCFIDQRGNEDRLKMLKEVLMEQTKAVAVDFGYDPEADYRSGEWGYIDHQSAGTSDPAFADKETLRNFIFNRHSRLETDNDN